ncbi:DUF4097 family beta strand repeat-containing protein [Parvimonas micra]|uniref:DUF4097 family beta strand repeat-containing protein n=1 Tax=Parvimonas micra TaxID=33033 RepID=UPI001E49B636|nr:DUF4097 family beta strand repeat-containing protein [Parvimonas micra]MCE3020287.1 DUF4097 family beta strand repeat-containing protein [Parvimonas micra]
MNNKVLKTSIIMLILGFVLFLLGIQNGGLEYIKDTDIDSYRLGNSTKINKYTIELDKITSTEVKFIKSNFKIKKSENGKNYIEYFSENEEDFKITNNEGKLLIEDLEEDSKFSFSIIINLNFYKNLLFNDEISNKSFVLYLSEPELENFNFNSFSSKVTISDVNIKNIKISQNAGNCDFKNINSENIELTNLAGNIDLNKVNNSNHFRSVNKAGNLYVEDSKFNSCKVDKKAGNVSFSNVEINELLEVENNAGNINCSLLYDENVNYDVDLDSDVGNIYIDKDFNKNREESKTVKIILKSKAGNIKLEKN